jgi:hypothetical protein
VLIFHDINCCVDCVIISNSFVYVTVIKTMNSIAFLLIYEECAASVVVLIRD